ncbi:MAG TPA: hypothetical protein PKY82_01880 [Pyrinomonadaceae bacterium]|nr:hypothetical protein [Pyrinomonadaceae bacterium]
MNQTSFQSVGANSSLQFSPSFKTPKFVELTQAEKLKLDSIFKCLISELRGQRFEKNGEFSDLVFELPKFENSMNFGSLDTDELFKLGVCPIPNFILNALVCEKLVKLFGDLSICGCFRKDTSDLGEFWRIDIDEKLSRQGVFLPVRSRDGYIYGLKVFRYPGDQRPFLLKARRAQ